MPHRPALEGVASTQWLGCRKLVIGHGNLPCERLLAGYAHVTYEKSMTDETDCRMSSLLTATTVCFSRF
jgi:hypothetical protein